MSNPHKHATQAAEAVRALNHATLRRGAPDWRDPDDVYAVVGSLTDLARRLPQALNQAAHLAGGLTGLVGQLTADHGSPEVHAETARQELLSAALAVDVLSPALSRAHAELGVLGYVPDEVSKP